MNTVCIPINNLTPSILHLRTHLQLVEKERNIATTMAFTNITLPFASAPICAMHVSIVHVHVQASADQIQSVVPYAMSVLTSFVSSNWSTQWEWHWTYLLYAFLTWQIFYILHLFWWKAPVRLFPPSSTHQTNSRHRPASTSPPTAPPLADISPRSTCSFLRNPYSKTPTPRPPARPSPCPC
jgi:hypothetical protein